MMEEGAEKCQIVSRIIWMIKQIYPDISNQKAVRFNRIWVYSEFQTKKIGSSQL